MIIFDNEDKGKKCIVTKLILHLHNESKYTTLVVNESLPQHCMINMVFKTQKINNHPVFSKK